MRAPRPEMLLPLPGLHRASSRRRRCRARQAKAGADCAPHSCGCAAALDVAGLQGLPGMPS